MKSVIDPAKHLKNYFLKSLLIDTSLQSVDANFGDNISRRITNHILLDPFNVDIQDEEDQVEVFNEIMGTNFKTIKWSKRIPTNVKLDINESNKEELISNAISQIYLNSSVMLFENVIDLIKILCESKANNSIGVINDFYNKFKCELNQLDQKNIHKKWNTVVFLHLLRIFRNCIIHSGSLLSEIEKKIKEYNNKLETDRKYKILESLGHMPKLLIDYELSPSYDKITLTKAGFKKLSETYSQIAYIAYSCYCNRNKIPKDILINK